MVNSAQTLRLHQDILSEFVLSVRFRVARQSSVFCDANRVATGRLRVDYMKHTL